MQSLPFDGRGKQPPQHQQGLRRQTSQTEGGATLPTYIRQPSQAWRRKYAPRQQTEDEAEAQLERRRKADIAYGLAQMQARKTTHETPLVSREGSPTTEETRWNATTPSDLRAQAHQRAVEAERLAQIRKKAKKAGEVFSDSDSSADYITVMTGKGTFRERPKTPSPRVSEWEDEEKEGSPDNSDFEFELSPPATPRPSTSTAQKPKDPPQKPKDPPKKKK